MLRRPRLQSRCGLDVYGTWVAFTGAVLHGVLGHVCIAVPQCTAALGFGVD